jgi:circadian clock protein KaiB
LTPTPVPKLQLRLYLVSGAPNSIAARANLAAILAGVSVDAYSLEIVDIAEDPHRAIADGIMVTPTLLKRGLAPLTIVGSLSDTKRVADALGLESSVAGAGSHV